MGRSDGVNGRHRETMPRRSPIGNPSTTYPMGVASFVRLIRGNPCDLWMSVCLNRSRRCESEYRDGSADAGKGFAGLLGSHVGHCQATGSHGLLTAASADSVVRLRLLRFDKPANSTCPPKKPCHSGNRSRVIPADFPQTLANSPPNALQFSVRSFGACERSLSNVAIYRKSQRPFREPA